MLDSKVHGSEQALPPFACQFGRSNKMRLIWRTREGGTLSDRNEMMVAIAEQEAKDRRGLVGGLVGGLEKEPLEESDTAT